MKKTLVIGLGNPILTDDGIGLHVAEAIEKALPENNMVEVLQASVGGLTLMEMMVGYDRVYLVDAYLTECPQPGKVHRMTLDNLKDFSPTQNISSPHDATLVTAIEMGRRMGLPLPEEVIVYAIEVENVSEFGDEPTPLVANAIPHVSAMILDEINRSLREN